MRISFILCLCLPLLIAFPVQGQERPGPARAEMESLHRELDGRHSAREHLGEAGFQKMGHRVEEQMGHLERRMQSERHHRPAADHHAPNAEDSFPREVLGAIDELNRAVHPLREEVRSIRRDGDRSRDREE